MRRLAEKKQTEGEIHEHVEWSLKEYVKAIDRLKIKRSISFVKAYIIPNRRSI
jgi:hypothetical protein